MHPYKLLPDRQFWSKAVSGVSWPDMFKNEQAKFLISKDGKITDRFTSKITPDSPEATKAIEAALAAK